MNTQRLQLALREWWAHISQIKVALIMLAVTCVLVLSGPFNTITFPWPIRIIYWILMVWGTYSIGYFIGVLTDRMLAASPQWMQILGFAGINGIAICLFVLAVNVATFGGGYANLLFLAELWAVAALISGLMALVNDAQDTQTAQPILLDRLPPPLRGPIIALSAEDHYTRIRTSQGEDLVLITLRDAIREAAPTQGLQIHRSHWVALQHILKAGRSDGNMHVTTTGGHTLPVSRANIPRLRELGF